MKQKYIYFAELTKWVELLNLKKYSNNMNICIIYIRSILPTTLTRVSSNAQTGGFSVTLVIFTRYLKTFNYFLTSICIISLTSPSSEFHDKKHNFRVLKHLEL